MSYDGLFLHAMIQELNDNILDGQVNKITHPNPYETLLKLEPIVKIMNCYYQQIHNLPELT